MNFGWSLKSQHRPSGLMRSVQARLTLIHVLNLVGYCEKNNTDLRCCNGFTALFIDGQQLYMFRLRKIRLTSIDFVLL